MAFPTTSTFLFPDNSGPSTGCNAAVQVETGTGLTSSYSGSGGVFTISAFGALAALSNINTTGLYAITGNGSAQTLTLSSDGSIIIGNPTGVLNEPVTFTVEPEFTVQKINHYLNGSLTLSAVESGINWVPLGDVGITLIDDPTNKRVTVEISATGGGGGGGVTSVATNNGLTGGPITTTGTIELANPCYTPGNLSVTGELSITDQYIFPATQGSTGQVIASTGGTGTAWVTPSGGGAVSSVASSNSNEILVSPTIGNVLLSLPNAMTVPGSLAAVTSLSAPLIGITYGGGSYVFPQGAGSSGEVIGWGSGTNPNQLVWVTNGSGGGGTVTSVGVNSPNSTIAYSSTTTNPITASGIFHLDLASQSSAGSYTNANITVNAYGIVTAASNGSGGGGVPSITGTASEILVNGTFGSPVTTASTLTLSNTLVAPGTFAATTSVTTPILNMVGSGYSYALPITNGSSGQYLQSIGGGQCIWSTPSGGSAGITSNVFYCNASSGPTLQTQVNAAIAATTSGNIYTVVVSPGTFPASTASLTISGATNGVGLQGYVNSGSSAPNVFGNSNINGNLIIGTSSSVVLNDVNVTGNTTISVSGNNYFNNMTFAGTTEVQGTTGTIVFSDCTFGTTVTVDVGFTGICVFFNCNFLNTTPVFNQPNPLNVQIQRCYGITSSTISNCTFAGLNTLSTFPYNAILNQPTINIPGTGQYALPTNTPTSGYVIQATGTTTSAWMAPSVGIPSGQGTASQVLVNNTFGSPQTGALTFALSSALIAPGTFQATTSVTTPVLSMAGSGYTYNLPVTTGSAPTNGYFLQYQSAGGGQCVWAPGGGGGGGITSVATGGAYSSGLLATTVSSAVTLGWDPSTPVVLPSSLTVNSPSSPTGTQFTLPTTPGAPGYTITYPDSGTTAIWSANYVTQILGTTNQIVATGPTPPSTVVTLSFPSVQNFPGNLQSEGTISATGGSPVFNVTGSPLTNFWPTFPSVPGGILTSNTSGNLGWANFPLYPSSTTNLYYFYFGGSNSVSTNITFTLAANGESVNIRIPLATFQSFVCDNTTPYCITNTSIPSNYAPSTPSDDVSIGFLPIYNVSTGNVYYGQLYLTWIIGAPHLAFVLGCDIGANNTLFGFSNTNTYSFGVDNTISGISNAFVTFNYPINI